MSTESTPAQEHEDRVRAAMDRYAAAAGETPSYIGIEAALELDPESSASAPDFGPDDPITRTDVAGVLAEIAQDFDGGEYAISDETRRVLIDFAQGLPDHPLFEVVGHHFAQNPVVGSKPMATT